MWLLTSGALRDKANNPGYYKSILIEFHNFPGHFENQIEIDLKRTFPKNQKFNTTENLNKLKNILIAYSRRNVVIGYVQGFNFIAGRIIQVIPDEVI